MKTSVLGVKGFLMFHGLTPALTHLNYSPFHFQIGVRFARQQDPLPYMVSQPLPWQVHSVSHSRKSSRADEVSGDQISTSVDCSEVSFFCECDCFFFL